TWSPRTFFTTFCPSPSPIAWSCSSDCAITCRMTPPLSHHPRPRSASWTSATPHFFVIRTRGIRLKKWRRCSRRGRSHETPAYHPPGLLVLHAPTHARLRGIERKYREENEKS